MVLWGRANLLEKKTHAYYDGCRIVRGTESIAKEEICSADVGLIPGYECGCVAVHQGSSAGDCDPAAGERTRGSVDHPQTGDGTGSDRGRELRDRGWCGAGSDLLSGTASGRSRIRGAARRASSGNR